jgi:hypothetical protein
MMIIGGTIPVTILADLCGLIIDVHKFLAVYHFTLEKKHK